MVFSIKTDTKRRLAGKGFSFEVPGLDDGVSRIEFLGHKSSLRGSGDMVLMLSFLALLRDTHRLDSQGSL